MEKYDEIKVHKILKEKCKEGDILNIEDLVYIFGTNNNIKEYEKYKLLKGSKTTILNRFQKHCVVKEKNNNQYEILKIRKSPISNKTLRILQKKKNQEALYYLIILFTKYLEEQFLDDGKGELNIVLFDLAFSVNLINNNYKTIRFNQNEVAEYYKTREEYVCDFIEYSNHIIKKYIEKAIDMLIDYDIITSYKNRKLIKSYKRFLDDRTVQEYEEAVWATNEENVLINRIIDSIFQEYQEIYQKEYSRSFTFQDFYFGKYSKEINIKLHKELKEYDIIRFYSGYCLTTLISNNMTTLLKELPDGNKSIENLTRKMNKLVIEEVCNIAEIKDVDREFLLNNNLSDIYTGMTSIDTVKKLSKISLNYNSEYKLYKKLKLTYKPKKAVKIRTIENVKVLDRTKIR